MLILHSAQWLLYIRSVSLALRAVVFDQYMLFIQVIWSAFIGFWILIGVVTSWWIVLVATVVGAGLYRYVVLWVLRRKYLLIRNGDTIEYALPDESNIVQQFAKRKVRYYLSRRELAMTTLFDPEQIDFYEHFFLVDDGKKSVAIPFEWINSIEID